MLLTRELINENLTMDNCNCTSPSHPSSAQSSCQHTNPTQGQGSHSLSGKTDKSSAIQTIPIINRLSTNGRKLFFPASMCTIYRAKTLRVKTSVKCILDNHQCEFRQLSLSCGNAEEALHPQGEERVWFFYFLFFLHFWLRLTAAKSSVCLPTTAGNLGHKDPLRVICVRRNSDRKNDIYTWIAPESCARASATRPT